MLTTTPVKEQDVEKVPRRKLNMVRDFDNNDNNNNNNNSDNNSNNNHMERCNSRFFTVS